MTNRLKGYYRRLVSSEISSGVVGSFAIKAGHILIGLLVTVVLARWLGPDKLGTYSYTLVLVIVVSLPVQAGVYNLLTREVAAGQQRREYGLMKGLVRRVYQGVGMYSIVVIALGIGSLMLLESSLSPEQWRTGIVSLVFFVLMAQLRISTGLLRGLRHVLLSQLPDLVVRQAVLLFLLLTATLYWGLEASAYGAMMLHVVAAVFGLCLSWVWYARVRPGGFSDVKPRFAGRIWMTALLPLTAVRGLNMLNSQLSILILGPLLSSQSVGIYRVAAQAAVLVSFALSAINVVLGPHVARLHAAGDTGRLQRLVTTSTRVMAIVAVCVAGVFLVFGEPIVTTLFGDEFRSSVSVLAILCIGQLVNACVGPVGLVLNMTGNERDATFAVAIAVVINIALSLSLVPVIGADGAAVATSVSLIVSNLILARLVWLRNGLIAFVIGNRQAREI